MEYEPRDDVISSACLCPKPVGGFRGALYADSSCWPLVADHDDAAGPKESSVWETRLL